MTIDTKKLRDTARRVLNRPSTFTAVDRDELACGVIALSIEFDACKSGAAAMVARVQEESKRKSDQLAAANAEIDRLRASAEWEREINHGEGGLLDRLAAMTASALPALEAAETALHDAMHAGNLSREYHDSAIVKVEGALAELRKVGQ